MALPREGSPLPEVPLSRSRRKTPVQANTTATSEKADKLAAHRRIRRRVSQVLRVDPEVEVLPHDRDLSNPWLMDKDGKSRFDPAEFPKSMRK